jgi:hypothetical protein
MARALLTLLAAANPTLSAVEQAFDSLMVARLTSIVLAFNVVMTDQEPATTRYVRLVVDTDTAGATMTSPYQLKGFQAPDEASAIGLAADFIAANPTAFISPAFYRYSDQLKGQPNRVVLFVVYNLDQAGGAANWQGTGSADIPVDVQVFLSSGTWIKPPGAEQVQSTVIGGGAGGGSGRRGGAGTVRRGGGGGGGGGYLQRQFSADEVSATEAVTVGAAGVGGPAATVDNTSGSGGTAGGATSFGERARATGGSQGTGGGSGTGGTGGAASAIGGGAGGTASTTGGVGAIGARNPNYAAGSSGAGAGGGITTADAANRGGTSAANISVQSVDSLAGVAPGGNGETPAANAAGTHLPGRSGGGGAGGAAGGGMGGDGRDYGGAGGGGGASTNGANSGSGGNGAPGVCVVISW